MPYLSAYKYLLISFCICIALSWTACNIINPAEELPVYFQLSKALVTDKNTGDTSTMAAKVVWIETGADSLGFFPIPTTVASLSGTAKQYTIYGGISELAQGFVAIYPFWKPFYLNVDSTKTKIMDTLKVYPKFEYYSDTVLAYKFQEKFETTNLELSNSIGTSVSIDLNMSNDRYEGAHSGVAHFEAEKQFFKAETKALMDLPADKVEYVEVTYKTNIPFEIGLNYSSLFGFSGEVPVTAAVADTSNQWKTVFLRLNNLTNKTPAEAQPAQYTLFFRATGNGTMRDLYLDNVRVIARK